MLNKFLKLFLYFSYTYLTFGVHFINASEISITNQIVQKTSFTEDNNNDGRSVVKSESILKSEMSGKLFQVGYEIDARYRHDIKVAIDDNHTEFKFRDAFIDYDYNGTYWRLGKQTIVWGASDGLRLLDVINPLNYREFILDDFDNSRISLTSVSAEFPINDGSSLTIIIIPELTFNQYAKPYTQFTLNQPLPTFSQSITAVVLNSTKVPKQSIKNSELALRFASFFLGWDISLNYFYHYQDDPVVFIDVDGDTANIHPEYKRNILFGGMANNAFGNFVLRTEFAFNNSHYYATSNASERFVNESKELKYVIGLDYSGISDTQISGQWFRRELLSYEPNISEDAIENTLTLLVRRNYANETISIETLALHSLDNSDGLIRPKIKYELNNNIHFELSADIFYGDSSGLFGQFSAKDQLTLGASIGF
jgi:hypothetical protein